MDGGQIMVIVIVAMALVASIVRAGIRGPRHRFAIPEGQPPAENQRLRDEVKELKERIKVLERITVEKENSLANEIESLRDR